ncbi:hypothetical protein HaLaN_01537, partial [Haematococcus lacustris]
QCLPELPGWTFLPGLDLAQTQALPCLVKDFRSLEALGSHCFESEEVVAFNTKGHVAELSAVQWPGKEATSNLPLISKQKMSILAGQAVEGPPLYRCYSIKELYKLAKSAEYSGWVGLPGVARPIEGDGWVWLQ